MLGNIIKTFERSFILCSKQFPYKNNSVDLYINSQKHRFLVCSTILRNVENVSAVPPTVGDADPEYIVPYKPQWEKCSNIKGLTEALRTKFHLNKEELEHIVNNDVVSKTYRHKSMIATMDLLILEGVTKENLIEYPWLITLDKKKLQDKMELLKILEGYRDINDFVPFLRLQIPRLRKLVSSLNRETYSMNNVNRVYFISQQLNVLPCIVTKYLAKRLFVLEMPFEMFKTNLQHMIKYKVEAMNILKDLWGFRYAPRAVELRLKRALQAKKDKIMPWMVRCPEPILQKSLQISLDELQVLGNKTSIAEYIGERLGFSAEEGQAIMDRHPQVNTVRVTKIKEVLDYLLDEAQFTRHEVAQVPRILCHSLKTTKQRIEELKKYGCRPSTLVIVCRTKREYGKFLQQWQESSKLEKNLEDTRKKENP